MRRIRKTDNNRLARIAGATIVNRPEELQESDVGTKCGLFDVKKIGDEVKKNNNLKYSIIKIYFFLS